jgi:transcription elongation factor GreA
MSHSIVADGARKQLIEQLVYFDESKIDFLNHYYPAFGKERDKVDKVLGVYTRTIEQLLADKVQDYLHNYVWIGSRVDLQYIEDGDKEQYTIVFPHHADADRNRLSFLSPIGLQLLLARTGERYMLTIPSGEIEVLIDRISYVGLGDVRP